MHLNEIEATVIDEHFKGVPGGAAPLRLDEIGSQDWNLLRGDLPMPVAVLKQSALDHNSRWMRRFLERTGAKICPHGKTTMSPQLFAQQLDDGAWGITLATVAQVRIARRYGVGRILLANQLVDRSSIKTVLRELDRDASFDFYCLVDSIAGVELLSETVKSHGSSRPLQVLVEVGVDGGRCGCRDVQTAMEVARAVHATKGRLVLRGVEGFEGLITGDSPDEQEAAIRDFGELMTSTARQCAEEQLFGEGPVILTAGGSAFFDLVIDPLRALTLNQPTEVVIRSGCYLTHDSKFYRNLHERLAVRSDDAGQLGEGLRPAIEVWSAVQSRPEPTRAVLTLGRRDASYDIDLPTPICWHRPGEHEQPIPVPPDHRIVSFHDQHALVDVPAGSPWQVGDLVACGISHPCTTFDRWRLLMVVDDQYQVTGGIVTFF
jgi:D-serine dehydratase